MNPDKQILQILSRAKVLARKYYKLTGKPLGVTGEIAEYEAARILKVKLTQARQAAYDAFESVGKRKRKLQIKGRCLQNNSKRGQRLGSIRTNKGWDAILMVLLNDKFEATEIWEAKRSAVLAALTEPGSKARNERGALSVSKFKSIGKRRWPVAAA
jgi:hypothetical protein